MRNTVRDILVDVFEFNGHGSDGSPHNVTRERSTSLFNMFKVQCGNIGSMKVGLKTFRYDFGFKTTTDKVNVTTEPSFGKSKCGQTKC